MSILVVTAVALSYLYGISGPPDLSTNPDNEGSVAQFSDAVQIQMPSTLSGYDRVLGSVGTLNIPSQYLYLPNPAAVNNADGPVMQMYDHSPAPMGVVDYGMMEPSGFVIPYQYNTSSFQGQVMFEQAKAYYSMNSHPNSLSVQMSAVLSGVTINGQQGNDFWVKSVMYYTPETSEAQFISNIWYLSSPSMQFPQNAISAGNGTVVPGVLYYSASAIVTVPDEIRTSLFLNSVNINGSNAVQFQYQFSSEEMNYTGPIVTFDTVVFNSLGSGLSEAPNAVFEVNGFTKTKSGLLYDAEIVVTGPGMGSTTTVYSANGQLTLKFKAADGTYTRLPAAYNYGSNTGETIQGLSVWWSSLMKPMAHLSLGPSLLVSMWGSQESHSGAVNIQGTIDPPNSFVFISKGGTFDNSTAAWAPIKANGSYKFSMPGRIQYSIMVMLSNYEPVYFTTAAVESEEGGDHGTGEPHGGQGGSGGEEVAAWYNATLNLSLSNGIYTPLYANGNSQLKYLTVGSSYNGSFVGNGTAANPYIIENSQFGNLNMLFNGMNNFLYPSFSGIQVMNTNSSFVIGNAPSFHVSYSDELHPILSLLGLPAGNSLNMVFYNTSGMTFNDSASVAGWFSSTMSSAPAASLMIIDSRDFLVASNNFQSMGSSVIIYNSNNGASNGTVWGNHFLVDHVIGSSYSKNMKGSADPAGITVSGSGNLIYNNFFAKGASAGSPDHDIYTGNYPVDYTNNWNLSEKMPVNYATVVNGLNLTGSIVDSGYQGGNFWSEKVQYIPYNSSGKIAKGGDYYPLMQLTYNATFNGTGLPAGIQWSVSVDNGLPEIVTGNSIVLELANGTHNYRIAKPSNYSATPSSGTIQIQGVGGEKTVKFTHIVQNVTFTQHGLPAGLAWGVNIAGEQARSMDSTITFVKENGTYSYEIIGPDNYSISNSNGKVLVYGTSTNEPVTFRYALHSISVHITGLPAGSSWTFEMSGQTYTTASSTLVIPVSNGVHEYSISLPGEFVASPPSGTIMVLDSDIYLPVELHQKTYEIHFLHNGIPNGVKWGVQFGNETINSTSSAVSFTVPAGNYSYTILVPDGYTASNTSGQVVVSVDGQTTVVDFARSPDYGTTALMLTAGAAIGLAIGLGITMMYFRRR